MIFVTVQVISVFLVAITMALALAHALELPGKLRLSKDVYIAVQPIYYPGFTFGGLTEPLAIIVTLILLLRRRSGPPLSDGRWPGSLR